MGSASAAFSFLIETLVGLYLVVLLLRILLEAVRANFFNPVCQMFIQLTEPLVKPVGRLIPRLGSVNLAAITVLLILQFLGLLLTTRIGGLVLDWPVLIALTAQRSLRLLLMLYVFLIIISVILSWIGQNARHPIIPLIYQLTDPVLAPIRRVLPPLGGFDLSPLIAIIAIQFLVILLGIQ